MTGHGVAFKQNDKRTLRGNYELDFLLKDKGIAIELDGLFYHSEGFGSKGRSYHLKKTEECASKGIRLIHVYSDEWDYKTEIVKSKLVHILGLNTNPKVYGRKCYIKEVENKAKNDFLTKNHIQGTERSSCVKLGAFEKGTDRLVALMTFGKLRKNLGNRGTSQSGQFELIRFATDIRLRCVGLASKLLKHFRVHYGPRKIVTYADRRWSTNIDYRNDSAKVGNLYTSLGFVHTSTSQPGYWYLSPKTEYKRRENRFRYRKSELPRIFEATGQLSMFDPKISEWKNLQNLKYDRTWDCGNYKYTLECEENVE